MRLVFILLFCFLIRPITSLACECPLSSLSMNECERYEVILRGKVVQVKTCDDRPGEAVFEVLELYKGNASHNFKVLFNCNDACFYLFKPGEEWILYSRYKQVNTAYMDWCSRSRRYFSNAKEDFYTSTYGNDYEEELAFLRKNLGLHRLVKEDLSQNYSRNVIPDKAETVWILLASAIGIILFYVLFKRWVK
jgi:hypothetical protein